LPNFRLDGRVTSTPDLNLLGVGTNSETASPLSTSTTAFSSNAPALMTLAHSDLLSTLPVSPMGDTTSTADMLSTTLRSSFGNGTFAAGSMVSESRNNSASFVDYGVVASQSGGATLRGGLAKKQFPMSSPAQGRHTVEKSDARAERYAKPALATPLFVTIVMIACICLAAPVCFFARRRKRQSPRGFRVVCNSECAELLASS